MVLTMPDREFSASEPVRKEVPLLFGVFGASGAGKTESGHRIAQGMREVLGGELYVLDTEAGRAKVLYDLGFKFKHIPFAPPFGSLDFLKAIRDCVRLGARVVQIDSMSMEHTGIGGFLERHDSEAQRLADAWKTTPEKASMFAWNVVKAERRRLIGEIVQLGTKVAFVFCFRAAEKSKPGTGGSVINLGFMPETDAKGAFVYELTASALLLPRAEGEPTWTSADVGAKLMVKLPGFFRPIFEPTHKLCEEDGRKMATWAQGDAAKAQPLRTDDRSLDERATALVTALKTAKTLASLEKTWNSEKAQSICHELDESFKASTLEALNLTYESQREMLK